MAETTRYILIGILLVACILTFVIRSKFQKLITSNEEPEKKKVYFYTISLVLLIIILITTTVIIIKN